MFQKSYDFLGIALICAVIEFKFCDTLTILFGQTRVKGYDNGHSKSNMGKLYKGKNYNLPKDLFCPLECPLVVLLVSISCPQIAGLTVFIKTH